MPQMIAALFQDGAAAQRALQALIEAGVARDRIAVVGEAIANKVSEVSALAGFRELSARDDELAQLHDLPLPEEDLELFERGLRQGHVLISARVDGADMEEAIGVIEMFDPIDLDRRSEEWSGRSGGEGADVGGSLAAGITGGSDAGQTNTAAVPGMGQMTDHTDDLGTADLRTDETSTPDMGLTSTTATGHRREEERAGRPGVMELDQSPDASLATKMAPGTGPTASGHGNAKPDLYRRESTRIGRVRAYSRD